MMARSTRRVPIDVNRAIALYRDGRKSIPQVSMELGATISTVRARLLEAGVQLRSRADGVRLRTDVLGQHLKGKSRNFSAAWKANMSLARRAWAEKHAVGVSVKPNGYVEYTRGPHKGRLVHDVLMEVRLGRRLQPGETVHFIDENRQNNDPENHELMTRSDHARLHRLKELQLGKFRKRDRYGRFC